MLNAIGDHAQRKCRCLVARFGLSAAICQHAGKFRNLANPPTVFFALDFDPKHYWYPFPARQAQSMQ